MEETASGQHNKNNQDHYVQDKHMVSNWGDEEERTEDGTFNVNKSGLESLKNYFDKLKVANTHDNKRTVNSKYFLYFR